MHAEGTSLADIPSVLVLLEEEEEDVIHIPGTQATDMPVPGYSFGVGAFVERLVPREKTDTPGAIPLGFPEES